MAPLRLSNVLYAAPRMIILSGAVLVTGCAAYMVIACDVDWTASAILLVLLGVLSGSWLGAAVADPWWLEVGDGGIRYRTLFGVRSYDWAEVSQVRPLRELSHAIPGLGSEMIEFTLGRRKRVTIHLRKRDRLATAERLGPRWTEKGFAAEANWRRRAIGVGVIVVVYIVARIILWFVWQTR